MQSAHVYDHIMMMIMNDFIINDLIIIRSAVSMREGRRPCDYDPR
jgi:hypothetical protein